MNFKTALNHTLGEMLQHPENADCMCMAVYWDDNCDDNAIVMFMELGRHPHVHACMKELYEILSNKLGHPVSLCHNHATDESILIHGSADDSRVFYSDECCKRSAIESYKLFCKSDRTGYRDELRSLFLGAECLAEGLGKTPEYILQCLDWNMDPQAQVIQLLIDYHN